MKKTVIILAALMAGASLQAQAPASSYSVTVDFPYVSRYVFRGDQLASESVQPSIEVASGNWYGGVWMNQPLIRSIDNEIDFYLGYGVEINDVWAADLGVTVYYYPELKGANVNRTTNEFYLGVNGTTGGFSPSAYVYYDTDLKTWTVQGAIGYSVALSDQASLDFSATLGHVDPEGVDSHAYYGLGVNLPYALSEKATVYAGVQYASTDKTGAKNHTYFMAGITLGL